MPKIVWLDKDKVKEKEIPVRGFITVGRGKDNTIVLDDSLVSRHHARLLCGPHGCLLKDLGSDDGVRVNGDHIKSQFLHNGDIIRIGHHVLEYTGEEQTSAYGTIKRGGVDVPSYRFDTGGKASGKTSSESNWSGSDQRAFLRFTSGPEKGRIQNIDRPLLSVGQPDSYYAAVSRRTNGYYLLNLGKGLFAKLNGQPVHGEAARLENGDMITLGENRIEVRIFDHR